MSKELEREVDRLRRALMHIASRYEEVESSKHFAPGPVAWAMHSDAIQALEEDYEFGDRGYLERRKA